MKSPMAEATAGRNVLLALALVAALPPLAAPSHAQDRSVAPKARSNMTPEERLWHHRNLGKAFYENPATQYEAVGELRKALELAPGSARERVNYGLALLRAGQVEAGIAELEKAQKQDPSIPHTWFNLGIAHKQQSRYEPAIVQLEKMVELVPDEPISHYNLAVLYKLEGRTEDAIRHFERAARLDPNLAGPHFQLATAFRQARRPEEAKRATAAFREIKGRQAGAAFPEDLEWSYHSELYETLDPDNARDDTPPAEVRFEARTVARRLDPATAGLAVFDLGGDGTADLLAWSSRGVVVLAGGSEPVKSGLEGPEGIVHIAPGDAQNDGLADLAVVTREGAELWVQRNGKLEKVPLPAAGPFARALWLDYDHDYDLDIFLLGGRSVLLRNRGEAGWADRTADFPFVEGRVLDATRIDVVADTQGMDLAVTYADRKGVVYRDLLGGRYRSAVLAGVPAGTRRILAHDANHDGWTDLTVASDTAAGDTVAALLLNNRGRFGTSVAVATGKMPVIYGDLENRGVSDLVTRSGLHRNRGMGELAPGAPLPGVPGDVAALAGADFDADGRLDLATVGGDGQLVLLLNRTETGHHWLRVSLEGVKNLRLAPGAEVEVKAGSRYQKKIYQGTPLHFGLGERAEVDTVRITWPNGLIQNEARQKAGAPTYKEAQRLSGSCPMIYTWNGEEFEFITDVLGVAPLGASAGDGEYFPVDHDEYIQIPGRALALTADGYEIRIVEELREVAYLDQVRLIAVDHPREIDVFTNDKFKAPPFPEFRLFGVEERTYPTSARDHHGQDVLDRLTALDRTYPDGFARDYAGVAELHHLDLDFGPVTPGSPGNPSLVPLRGNPAILVLSGWVDWADGSTFLGVAQERTAGLVMPYLQVRDPGGEWRTVIEDMGIPAGKPKSIVVDLTEKLPRGSREVRIVTNLCVYWDEIFLSEETGPPEVRLSDLHAATAELRFRGFSHVEIHPERKQPERFVYARRRSRAMWNPTPGLYTRFGHVEPLLDEVDDRLVVMGSGDELRLVFDGAALPTLPAGWKRDFLLLVDGWAKDGDANTAHSQTVEALPYHGMPQYPYEPPHRFPDDGPHNLYREHYNTRPALRIIRPLTEGTDR